MHAWHGHDERRIPPLVLGHEVVGTVRGGELAKAGGDQPPNVMVLPIL